jgi:hypothetical protein
MTVGLGFKLDMGWVELGVEDCSTEHASSEGIIRRADSNLPTQLKRCFMGYSLVDEVLSGFLTSSEFITVITTA